MNFSISSRQSAEYLKRANEIRVAEQDHRIIPDLAEKYPNALINLQYNYHSSVADWDQLKMYNTLCRGNFIIGTTNSNDLHECVMRGIKVYHRAPVNTFQELLDLSRAKVSQVIVGGPLFFRLKDVASFGIPVRHIANLAFPYGSLTSFSGINGTWIRPEDVEQYEPYINTLELFGNLKQEQALIRIYLDQKAWNGKISDIIFDLNTNAVNRMIPPELATTRLSCGQRCTDPARRCSLCQRYFDLADPERLRNINND